MDYLREIVEENEEGGLSSKTTEEREIGERGGVGGEGGGGSEKLVFATRQLSIESLGGEGIHRATSMEVTTTSSFPSFPSSSSFAAPPPPSSTPTTAINHLTNPSYEGENEIGLALDELDESPPPVPLSTTTNNSSSLTTSQRFAEEFPNTTKNTTVTVISPNTSSKNLTDTTEEVQSTSQQQADKAQEFADGEGNGVEGGEVTKVELRIGPQHFELLKLLGEGAFGKVILVESRLDHSLYAMKVISKKLLRKKNNVAYMKSERDILTRMSHPFLVSLSFAFQSPTKLFLVMEFLPGGELFLHLRKRGIILEKDVVFYLGEMILAIDFLHGRGVIHRDLKPENVLLRRDGHLCITDFGLAKEIGQGGGGSSGGGGGPVRTLCGTSEYMAPEMLSRSGYGKGVDWWALGALCYEMLVGKPPFQAKTQPELDRKILSEKLSLPPYLSATAHSLLRGMLDKDMNKRLGCAKSTMFNIGGVTALKQHEFFKGLDWFRLEDLELTPPIDLKKTDYTSTANNKPPNNPPAANTKKPAEPASNPAATSSAAAAAAAIRDNDEDPEESLNEGRVGTSGGDAVDDFVTNLKYFDSEFTSQVLSRSLVEDTLTPATTTGCHTPVPTGGGDGGELLEDDEFKDFEYIDERVTYTQKQIEQFEELFKAKQQKAQKKKLLKMKKDEERQREEEKRKEEEEKKKKELEELRKKQQAEAEAKKKKEEAEKKRKEKEKLLKQLENERTEATTKWKGAADALAAHQKKVKNVRKKLRDISELKEKKGSLDKDQQQKISKEPELVKELSELVVEEESFQAKNDELEKVLSTFTERENEIHKLFPEENPLSPPISVFKEEVKEAKEENGVPPPPPTPPPTPVLIDPIPPKPVPSLRQQRPAFGAPVTASSSSSSPPTNNTITQNKPEPSPVAKSQPLPTASVPAPAPAKTISTAVISSLPVTAVTPAATPTPSSPVAASTAAAPPVKKGWASAVAGQVTTAPVVVPVTPSITAQSSAPLAVEAKPAADGKGTKAKVEEAAPPKPKKKEEGWETIPVSKKKGNDSKKSQK